MLSPQQFIETIFEPALEEEIITLCPILESGAFWSEPWRGQRVHKSKRCFYFAPYTLKESAWQEREGKGPKLRRRIHDISSYFAIVLDDVGDKVDPPDVPPTWRLETSPGNEQWGYLLEEPEEDLARVNGFLDALKGRGISDDGALKLTQVFRLPGSWHYKHEVRAALREWAPDRLFTLEGLGESLGVSWSPIPLKTLPVPIPVADGYQDPVFDWLQEGGKVLRDEGEWVTVECPWGSEHSDDTKAYYSPMGRGAEFVSMRTFNCFHEACGERNTHDFLAWVAEQGGPRVQRENAAEVRGGAADYVEFVQAFPPVDARELPNCQWRRVVVDEVATFEPAKRQLSTAMNIHKVLEQMGITVRFNLVSGDPEFVPPETTQPGWFADLGDTFKQSNAVLQAVVDTCNSIGILNRSDIVEACVMFANGCEYNPVEDWVLSAPWDGQDRLEELLDTIELVNSHDIEIARMYLHRWSKQVMEAVRGYRRRRAKDMVLTFTGPQGCGKTTWIESLLPGEWVKSGVSLHLGTGAAGDRDSIRKATRAPIVELGELDATFRRSDISQLKSFLSQVVDEYRPSYGRTEIRRPRCTAYAGSVNHENFLTDVTGNRRYLVMPVVRLDGFHSVDMQQYWAQISAEWEADDSYHMVGEYAVMQDEMNKRFVNPSEVEDCFWYYFGEIFAGTFKGETKAAAMTTTAVAKLIGCRTDRGTLSQLSGLLSGTLIQQRRKISGVRNAYLLRVPAKEHLIHTLPGLKIVENEELDVPYEED